SLASDRLRPAEGLLDPLSHTLARRVPGMPVCDASDRGASLSLTVDDLGHVGGDAQLATTRDAALAVVVLVDTHRAPPGPFWQLPDHLERDRGLASSVGLGCPKVGEQPVSVLHQSVHGTRELCCLAPAFAHELGFGVRLRLVGLVAALGALEVGVAV